MDIFRSERVLLLLEMHPSGHRLFPNSAHQTPSARHVLSRFRFGGIRSFACELKVSDERHPACVRACVRVKFAYFKRISKNEKKNPGTPEKQRRFHRRDRDAPGDDVFPGGKGRSSIHVWRSRLGRCALAC